MKIAYFTCNFPPELGGIGTSCHYLANEVGRSHEVTVFLPARNALPARKAALNAAGGRSDAGGSARKGIEYKPGNYQIKLFKPWFSFGYADFAPQVMWLVKNFDIVHLYYPYYGVAEFLCLFKWANIYNQRK